MFGETCVAYITHKCLGHGSLWAKAAPHSLTTSTVTLNAGAVLSVCPSFSPTGLTTFYVLQRFVLVAWLKVRWGSRWGRHCSVIGCSVMVLCRLVLEWLRLETEAYACLCSELSACCSAATPRMSFNYWYTLLAPSVEGTGRVSKSTTAVATCWLSLGNMVCGIPSWLMAIATALT
jgi:hypothetical protein